MPRLQSLKYEGDRAVVESVPCCVCGKTHKFELDAKAVQAWWSGTHIQRAFPDMSAGDREILISGTCEPCWDELFAEE